MIKSLFILFISIISFNAVAQEGVLVDKIIAIVGDKIVLVSEIEQQRIQFEAQGGKIPKDANCKLLDQMLMQKMLLTQAEVDSIVISEEEVENEIDRRLRYFIQMIGSKEKLEEYYAKSLVEIKEDFREDIKSLLLSERMRAKVIQDVKVTPNEVKSFFKALPEDSIPYYNSEVELAQIIKFPKISDYEKQFAYDKLEGIKERIAGGEDFETMAIIYSEDKSTAEKGGDLGYFNRGEMVPEFEGAAFKLKEKGELSDIVKTKFGYHLLQLIERRGDKISVRHILVRPQVTSKELIKTSNSLDSLRKSISQKKDTFTFQELVLKHTQDDDTKHTGGIIMNPNTNTSFFETSQLDASMFFVIDSMKVGAVSKPIMYTTQDGKNGYRILKLLSRSKPHAANLQDDYDRIKAVALEKEQKEQMENWIKQRAAKTYIKIDDSYGECKLEHWKPVDFTKE